MTVSFGSMRSSTPTDLKQIYQKMRNYPTGGVMQSLREVVVCSVDDESLRRRIRSCQFMRMNPQ